MEENAMEIMRTKREYNKRKHQLLSEGFIKCGELKNTERFSKAWDRIILIQGWKRA